MNPGLPPNQRTVRFQGFELSLETGELRKGGSRIRLQDQPLKVLSALLQRPGQLVTREELGKLIWPNGSFGDVDHAINLAVTKLRSALGDSADLPHLIETLPRRGYRFIGAIENGDDPIRQERLPERAAEPPSAEVIPEAKPTRRNFVIALLCLLVVAGAVLVARRHGTPQPMPRVVDSAQITRDSRPKSRANFKLVTDGGRLYFLEGSLDDTEQNTSLMQVSTLGGDTARVPFSLRIPIAYEFSPVRSELLFSAGEFQTDHNERPLWALPLPAGPAHRVGDVLAADAAWAPDGRHIFFTDGKTIFTGEPDGSHVQKILSTEGIGFCYWIRVSPDGKRLRFTVFVAQGERDVPKMMEAAVDGTGLHALPTHDGCCGTWSPDGNYFFYHQGRDVWVLPERRSSLGKVELGEPVQLTTGPIQYEPPLPSVSGKELFVIGHQDRIELVHQPKGQTGWEPFLEGISAEEVDVSPDGQWVVYTSFPDFQLWRSKLDGSERLQLTFSPMNAHEPHWSPDGKQILFSDYPYRLFVVSANGGSPRQLLSGAHPDPDYSGAADWLPDGKSITFGRHLGCWDFSCWAIYRMNLETQQISKIEGSDGMVGARLSHDGRYVAALEGQKAMLYDFAAQKWTHLADAFGSMTWSRDNKSIYVTLKHEKEPTELIRIAVPSGHVERVADLKGLSLGGLWPDRVSLLPDDSPVLTLDRSNEEIYRLDLRYQ